MVFKVGTDISHIYKHLPYILTLSILSNKKYTIKKTGKFRKNS
jgi:hypothetical protein